MDFGTIPSVARSLSSALQNTKLEETPLLQTAFLDKLQSYVAEINDLLRGVEAEGKPFRIHHNYWKSLRKAVFDADDLIDEVITVPEYYQSLDNVATVIIYGERSAIQGQLSSVIKDIQESLYSFPRSILLPGLPKYMSHHERKFIRERSFQYEVDVIGRQYDLENIVTTLRGSENNHDDQRNVSALSIVGIRGVGKTTLARLVYKHPWVIDAFPLKLWIPVSRTEQEKLDVNYILHNILASITQTDPDQGYTMDQVQTELLELLLTEKYLLVLDGVSTVNYHEWSKLWRYLSLGARGSWILITTPSPMTPTITGGLIHSLSGLSKGDSWLLFERTASASSQPNLPDELIMSRKKIVDGCNGIPLAIRVAGSRFSGRDTSKWPSIQEELAYIHDDIMDALKTSFLHLESPIKSCLCYLALIPEGYVIEKEKLISLWMAQGYVVPLRGDQSLEDAAQEYFTILLYICFLQVVEKDAYGEIISCKVPDIIHDLACCIAGSEICILKDQIGGDGGDFGDSRHLTLIGARPRYFNHATKIRSLHAGGWYKNIEKHPLNNIETLLEDCKCLRTLDLSNLGITSLPKSIRKLLHLRYLNLSQNRDLKVLTNDITILVNLQTLLLNGCHGLTKLPEDLSRLKNLRVLDIKECSSLTCMPRGLGKLTKLHMLTEFILGERSLDLHQWFDQLEALKALQNLRGHLAIRIQSPKNARKEGAYLSNKVHLNHIMFSFTGEEVDGREGHEELMEVLQPHHNMKGLDLCGYNSVRMPGWITFLPNLVRLCLENCRELQYLPYLGNLVHLKVFHLENLLNMEYIFENINASASGSKPAGSQSGEVASLFPSLQQLHLNNLPKLKGWFRSEVGLGVKDEHMLISSEGKVLLQQLFDRKFESFIIDGCPHLESVSPDSRVEESSASGAGTSSTSEIIDPATAKTHYPKVIEELSASATGTSSTSESIDPATYPKVIEESLHPIVADAAFPDGIVNHEAFLYCSLFPPEYEFEKIALLQLWLADGIFDEEGIANDFFKSSQKMGFFEVSRTIFLTGDEMYTFKGNDRLVSKGSHLVRIEDTFNSNVLSREISHMSVSFRSLHDSSDLSQFGKFKQLRTLIFLQGHLSSLRQVPRDFFLSLKLLQTLDLSHTRLEELPNSIGNMKCLRYLDLTKTPIKYLPAVLDCLENLQTLKLRDCFNLSTLPKGMRKLEKLRHLDFDVLFQLRSMPEGMGALTNIRTLSAFIVGVEQGCSITELAKMNNLSGSFCISGLQNVVKDQAEGAYLCLKSQLRKLDLRWSDSKHKDINSQTEVLSFLEPDKSLEELRISCYGGSELPSWICDKTFCRLVNITLFQCENCSVLPSVGQLPALKSLNIVGFKKLNKIHQAFYGSQAPSFPKLERLTIQDMPSLESWDDCVFLPCFPQLSSLTVNKCPELGGLSAPRYFPSLEILEITDCNNYAPCLEEEFPSSLKTLIIEKCPKITEEARDLKHNHTRRMKLLKSIPNLWIDHQECSNYSEEEESEEEHEEK